MGVASLVTGFSKWLYHKNELIVWNDFVHVGANSGKQKVHSVIFRWVWPFSSWGSKSLVFSEWVFELSWFFAWQMWYNGFCLDQHRTLYLWLKCYSTAVLLVGPLAAARRVLWNRVCPSFHPAIFFGCFLGIGWSDFSEFQHGPRDSYQVVCDRSGYLGKTFFAPKILKIV